MLNSSGFLLEIVVFLAGCCIVLFAIGVETVKNFFLRQEARPVPQDRGDNHKHAPSRKSSRQKRPTHSGLSQLNGYSLDSQDQTTPDQWPGQYRAATGFLQSPINLRSANILYIPPGIQCPLKFNKQYFTHPRSMTLLNDGYSIILGTCYPNEYPILSGGPLQNCYRFNLAQFKWGPTNDEGSEHTINHKRFAMEMQLMHIKGEKVYATLEEAVTHRAVVFLSFLFEVTRQDNPFLAPLVNHLHDVSTPNTTYSIDPFPLCWLFQPFKSKYFHYEGSITCPPCTEGVDWLIQPEPMCISNRQLNAFRSINGFTGPILNNARPVQKLNNRTVQYFM